MNVKYFLASVELITTIFSFSLLVINNQISRPAMYDKCPCGIFTFSVSLSHLYLGFSYCFFLGGGEWGLNHFKLLFPGYQYILSNVLMLYLTLKIFFSGKSVIVPSLQFSLKRKFESFDPGGKYRNGYSSKILHCNLSNNSRA